jgi:hypothetical protein
MGEHGELHKHRNSFVKKRSITGRIFPKVQIEPMAMQSRHDALATEMLRRGYNHKSPYEPPDLSYLPETERLAVVDRNQSLIDLKKRCYYCKKNIVGDNNE